MVYKLPVFDPADPTRVAADLLADLAFGETSEAYRRLVLDEQVVEDLDAGAAYNRDPGLLEITARIKDPGKIDYVLGVIDSTIAQVRATAPDAQRLADLQRRLRYGFLMGLQTPDSVAARVTPFIALSGDLHGLDRLYATYAAITPADVHAAADLLATSAAPSACSSRGHASDAVTLAAFGAAAHTSPPPAEPRTLPWYC